MIKSNLKHTKLSSPSPGRTIKTSIRYWGFSIIDILEQLLAINNSAKNINGLSAFYEEYYALSFGPKVKHQADNSIRSLANIIISIWLIGVSTKYINTDSSLYDALSWFMSGHIDKKYGAPLHGWLDDINLAPLRDLSYGDQFIDLYPYIAELFETDKELFFKRDKKRTTKLNTGVYYTPSDVAAYMVNKVSKMGESSGKHGPWLDPACGTGIFLRAVVEHYIDQGIIRKDFEDIFLYVKENIYGVDISAQAIQSSIFAIMALCLNITKKVINDPWSYYKKLGNNFYVFDSVKLMDADNWVGLRDINGVKFDFKNIAYFISNPPYIRATTSINVYGRGSLDVNKSIYLAFIRMMWQLIDHKEHHGGIIVPLSVSFSNTAEFKAIREEMSNIMGDWFYEHYDRTPDSLFGDDVKTRNTIIFHSKNGKDKTSVFTTPLLRWNSRNRKNLFDLIPRVGLNDARIIENIPKLGSEYEKEIYYRLKSRTSKLGDSIIKVSKNANNGGNENKLYFGKTAYNWLPVYIDSLKNMVGGETRQKMDSVIFQSESAAHIAYGLLSSRVVYWLWRVEGDGFHLTKRFILSMPISIDDLSIGQQSEMESSAVALWEQIIKHPIKNSNSGVVTTSFCPHYGSECLDKIDRVVLSLLGVKESGYKYFENIIRSLIVVGREREKNANYLQNGIFKRGILSEI